MSNKLELTWYGKDAPIRVEPRLLIENASLSNCAACPDTENLLIHGDNLLALKALERKYAGQVKCVYIDPPYNTGEAFDLYDDNIEHSLWLELMYARLRLLRSLMRPDGFIFVNLDENEHAYTKVIMDELYGRSNFIGDIIWQKRKGGGNDSHYLALDHDYILVYAKDASKEQHPQKWRTSQSEEYLKRYKEIDSAGRRYYWDTVARNGLKNPIPVSVQCPDGTELSLNSQMSQDSIMKGLKDGTVRLIKSKSGWTLHHRVYIKEGQVQRSIMNDVGTNKTAGDEMESLFGNKKSFPYPKPEQLISRILELCTNPGDLVLDSFLGSGTTAAVAHKMGRRWIGVEMGEHAYTHCKVRLDKVIAGEDKGGVTKAENWNGGGGYRFFELAPSLINRDEFGEEIINPDYDANMLAAAVALHEGFTYQPDETVFWKQSKANEASFLFVTTRHVNAAWLASIHASINEGEYLSIACRSYDNGLEKAYPNIDIRKIPQMLLERCEFGKSDYNLNIVHPPAYEDEDE